MPPVCLDSSVSVKRVVVEPESMALIAWTNGLGRRLRAAAERVQIDVVAPE